mmetsp:Transcript_13875/g.26645  ORF Transcript_13875/g.26645 Transcript_13875/m.26645 type:complete len:202 (+) Transcript_13875:549-1154(+)
MQHLCAKDSPQHQVLREHGPAQHVPAGERREHGQQGAVRQPAHLLQVLVLRRGLHAGRAGQPHARLPGEARLPGALQVGAVSVPGTCGRGRVQEAVGVLLLRRGPQAGPAAVRPAGAPDGRARPGDQRLHHPIGSGHDSRAAASPQRGPGGRRRPGGVQVRHQAWVPSNLAHPRSGLLVGCGGLVGDHDAPSAQQLPRHGL